MSSSKGSEAFPFIDQTVCTECGACIQDCVSNAIQSTTMEIDPEACIRCGHCHSICPVDAVTWPFGGPQGGVQQLSEGARNMRSLIIGRRSIRQYKQEELNPSLLEEIITVTGYSPSGTNARQVGITVLRGLAQVKNFSDRAMGFFRVIASLLLNPITYPLLRIILGRRLSSQLWSYKSFIKTYYEGNDILTHHAPGIFFFHAPAGHPISSEDALIWAQTGALYAESLGLGTCFNGFLVRALRLNPKLRSMLHLPKGHRVYETFTIGFPGVSYRRDQAPRPGYSRII